MNWKEEECFHSAREFRKTTKFCHRIPLTIFLVFSFTECNLWYSYKLIVFLRNRKKFQTLKFNSKSKFISLQCGYLSRMGVVVGNRIQILATWNWRIIKWSKVEESTISSISIFLTTKLCDFYYEREVIIIAWNAFLSRCKMAFLKRLFNAQWISNDDAGRGVIKFYHILAIFTTTFCEKEEYLQIFVSFKPPKSGIEYFNFIDGPY